MIRYLLLCPAALRGAAAQAAAQVTGRPEDATPAFFNKPCNALGAAWDAAPSHYVTSVLMSERNALKLEALRSAFPGAHYARAQDVEREQWLASLGLQLQPQPPEAI